MQCKKIRNQIYQHSDRVRVRLARTTTGGRGKIVTTVERNKGDESSGTLFPSVVLMNVPEPSMTTLKHIELTCPICHHRFDSQAVLSTNSFGGKRTDFHERAAGAQPQPVGRRRAGRGRAGRGDRPARHGRSGRGHCDAAGDILGITIRVGLRGALGRLTPGPISTVWELSLSKSWLRYMAPTCDAGPRWVCNANGRGGSTHFSPRFRPVNPLD